MQRITLGCPFCPKHRARDEADLERHLRDLHPDLMVDAGVEATINRVREDLAAAERAAMEKRLDAINF